MCIHCVYVSTWAVCDSTWGGDPVTGNAGHCVTGHCMTRSFGCAQDRVWGLGVGELGVAGHRDCGWWGRSTSREVDGWDSNFVEMKSRERMGFWDSYLSIKGFVSGTEFFEPGNKDWGFSGRFRHGFCIFCYLYLFFANLEACTGSYCQT